MRELLEKLGINWKLLLAQGINFLVIFFVLKKTVYQPLIKILKERREKVEQGIRDADRAAEQLKDAEEVLSKKLAEADKKSFEIIEQAEKNAKERELAILAMTKEKEKQIVESAEKKALQLEAHSRQIVYAEAVQLVKQAVQKIAEQDPQAIDDALVAQAVAEIKKIHA